MIVTSYNKYENYIRVGHNATKDQNGNWVCSDLQNFPTPSTFGRTLHDEDVDAYTDLEGYTQRNRVRNDVEDLALGYNFTSDEDESYVLNRIQPEYIYVELIDKKQRTTVTDTNGYYKYIKDIQSGDKDITNGDTYWYDSTNQVMYDSLYNVVSNPIMSDYKQVTVGVKKVHKMYASDKSSNAAWIFKDEQGNWHTDTMDFAFSLVEQ